MTLFADREKERGRERQGEKAREWSRGRAVGGVGSRNLKMYKKYIKRKSPRCLRVLSVFHTYLPSPPHPTNHCVTVCVCVCPVVSVCGVS